MIISKHNEGDGNFHKRFYFSSWGEMVDYTKNAPSSVLHDDRASRRHEGGDKPWCGSNTFDQAYDLARNGWTEQAHAMSKATKPLFAKIVGLIEKPMIRYNVEGHAIDIGRYVDGLPECVMQFTHTLDKGGKSVVRVVYNVGANCGINTDTMIRKGTLVFTLCRLLEFHGSRVQLEVTEYTKHEDSGNTIITTLVKEPSQPFDPGRLAFALCNPSMLRRFHFGILETAEPHILSAISIPGGYGYAREFPPALKPKCDIYIPAGMGINMMDHKQMEQWLFTQLQNCGIKLRPQLIKAKGA